MPINKEELLSVIQEILEEEIKFLNQASSKIENNINELKTKEKQASDSDHSYSLKGSAS